MILSQNNTKLGKIHSFNISTDPCKKLKQCKRCYNSYCYARKIERLYPAFRAKNKANLELTKSRRFIKEISKELRFCGDYIRIHSSGEFYSQAYLDKWITIAEMFPAKIFYCYTKRADLDFWRRPKNFIVYLSDDLRAITGEEYRLRLISFDGITYIRFDKISFDGITYIRFDKSEPIADGFLLCKHQSPSKTQCDECLRCTEKGGRVCFDIH